MYLNYCIKHAKKKLQMDYQNLEGIQSLKGVAHTLGLRRTKPAGLRIRSQILPMATEQPVSGTDDPNHGAATSLSTSLLSGTRKEHTVFTS